MFKTHIHLDGKLWYNYLGMSAYTALADRISENKRTGI